MKAFTLAFLAGLLLMRVSAQQPLDVQLPSGTILHFDLTTAQGCPSGWTEYTAARGAYIVGLTNGGTKATLVGSALSDQENRTHTHPMPHLHTMAHQHPFSGTADTQTAGSGVQPLDPLISVATRSHGHTINGTSDGSSAANTGAASVANTGTQSTTIAPYLQYLMCQKD